MIIRTHVSSLRRAALTTALAGSLIAGTAACSNDSSDDAKSKPTPTATPSPSSSAKPSTSRSPDISGPHAKEKKEVLDTYAAFWKEQTKAYENGTVEGTDLRRYAGGKEARTPAFLSVRDDIRRLKKVGARSVGEPTHSPTVTSYTPRTKNRLPIAKVSDCMDISGWKTIDVDKDKVVPLPSDQPRQFITTAEIEKWPEGWQVLEIEPSLKRCTP
ncbi:hypothetical protein [Streptomyces sp. NRRL S-1868]|uniref:hypothetical protein n=1 Tax=Streptomyces sp. NRRL S-1868 TaxID=1463892 RepID=UPI0004C80935|nr:hypothetical protein [Streptomyces sp. NRRL S-1868]